MKRFCWTEKRVGRLIRMKVYGHRSFHKISRRLGCTYREARDTYARAFRLV